MRMLWRHLWPIGLRHIFRHYLINSAIFWKNVTVYKNVCFDFLDNFYLKRFPLWEEFNEIPSKMSKRVPVIRAGFWWNLNFLNRFSKKKKKAQISSFIKSFPVGAVLLHVDGQTAAHDEAKSRLWEFCERA
jgi:hypothetical protein